VRYAVISKEVGRGGTPHLQGFIHLDRSFIKAAAGTVTFWKSFPGLQRAHLESAFGSDLQSRDYCKKGGPVAGSDPVTYDGNCDLLLEHGSPVENTGSWKHLAAATSMDEVREANPEAYIRYFNQFEKITAANRMAELRALIPLRQIVVKKLMAWQIQVIQMVKNQTDRQILFVVDTVGNSGKSWLTRWMIDNLLAWSSSSGKGDDLAYSRIKHHSDLSVFDIPRSFNPDYLPWRFWEELKNGRVTSTKYQTVTVDIGIQKIVIFCNQMPDTDGKLSADRVVKYELNNPVRTLCEVPEGLALAKPVGPS